MGSGLDVKLGQPLAMAFCFFETSRKRHVGCLTREINIIIMVSCTW